MSIVLRFVVAVLCWIFVLAVPLGSSCLRAQDPTKPSAQILERLHSGTPEPSIPANDRKTTPIIKLKAIVMRDENHGTALLDIGGRKVRLQLERSINQINEAASSPNPLGGVEVDGVFYRVEEFTEHSILLNGQGRKLLVN